MKQHRIPKIEHKLGSHWVQPYRDEILVDDSTATMSEDAFVVLNEYSTTFPSGVYEGKMWKSLVGDKSYLCWYERSDDHTQYRICTREIIILDWKKVFAIDE